MLPPGPRTPRLWQSFQLIMRPAPYARELRERYGDAVLCRTLNGNAVAVFSAELAREVFAAPPEDYATLPVLAGLFGSRAVIATSGDVHRRQRKLLNPRFHGARVRAFLDTMQRVTRAHLASFRQAASAGTVVVMSDVAQALTLDVILETVFGGDERLDRARAREVLLSLIEGFSPSLVASRRLHTPLYPPWRKLARTRAAFDGWVDGLVAGRRARGVTGEDVLGLLLEARYEDGSAMDGAEIRDQLMTILLAGHETTAIAIAWGIYGLLREPKALERLRRDLDRAGPFPSAEAMVKLPYLEAVASESLRFEPVVTDVLRVCLAPLRIGRWTLHAGDLVAVMLGSILTDPRLYPEPHRFRPERFLERSYGAAEFLPFGGGQRRCLGAAFAEAELAIVLGTLVSEWDVALASDAPERSVRRNITMGPEHGVRLRVLGAREPARAVGRDALVS